MIAYVILAHQEFDGVAELLRGLYSPEDLYCICVNQTAIAEGTRELDALTALPNVYLATTPPTAWGTGITEAYLSGIDVCLALESEWESLVILTNTDVPLVPRHEIARRLASEYAGKVVVQAHGQPVELYAESQAQCRLYKDPFKEAEGRHDVGAFNPLTRVAVSTERDGVMFFTAPGGMRPGWTVSSHFITHLSRQVNVWENKEVFAENISKFQRRLLDLFFEGRTPAISSLWGVFPRDFCQFLVSSREALEYLSVVRDAFSIEESFFSTMALSPPFTDRLVVQNIMLKLPLVDGRMQLEDISPEKVGHHLFARKAPFEGKAAFYDEAYTLRGIPSHPMVERARAAARALELSLGERLRDELGLEGASLRFGAFADSFMYAVTLSPGGELAFEHGGKPPLGEGWRWDAEGLMILASGANYARFDGYRAHRGRLLLFGHWLHHPAVLLALVCELRPLLKNGVGGHLGLVAEGGAVTDLTAFAWSFWFGGDQKETVRFAADGSIQDAEGGEEIVGWWRRDGQTVLAFGLNDQILAAFEHTTFHRGVWRLSGTCWGRVAQIEPCFLRSLPDRLTDPTSAA